MELLDVEILNYFHYLVIKIGFKFEAFVYYQIELEKLKVII